MDVLQSIKKIEAKQSPLPIPISEVSNLHRGGADEWKPTA